MVTEDYVSLEVAKLLKEKGFNEKCRGSYHSEFDDSDNSIVMLEEWMVQPYNNDFVDEGFLCSAPTLQMTMKWLRKEHNLFIFPFPQRNTNKFWTEIFQLSDNQEWENMYCESIDLQDYQTYEEACEAAIKYCLENLI